MFLALGSCLKLVQTFEYPLFHARRHGRHGIFFIIQTKVIENFLAVLKHPLHALADDDGDFIGKSGIINIKRRNRAGQERAVSVLMLQTLAIERGAA